MCRECQVSGAFAARQHERISAKGISFFTSDPGYDKKDWQKTVLYEPQPVIRVDTSANYPLSVPFDKFALRQGLRIFVR